MGRSCDPSTKRGCREGGGASGRSCDPCVIGWEEKSPGYVSNQRRRNEMISLHTKSDYSSSCYNRSSHIRSHIKMSCYSVNTIGKCFLEGKGPYKITSINLKSQISSCELGYSPLQRQRTIPPTTSPISKLPPSIPVVCWLLSDPAPVYLCLPTLHGLTLVSSYYFDSLLHQFLACTFCFSILWSPCQRQVPTSNRMMCQHITIAT